MNDTSKSSVPGLEALPEPGFEFLFGMSLEVGSPNVLGHTPAGERRVIGVEGGVFSGPHLEGKVLPGGSDWIVVREDGVLIQDVRVTLHTYDGHALLMSYRGMRHGSGDTLQRLDGGEDVDPSEYYFRTIPALKPQRESTTGSTSCWPSVSDTGCRRASSTPYMPSISYVGIAQNWNQAHLATKKGPRR